MWPITNWDDVPVVMDIPFVSRLLGMSPETVRRHITEGKIPAAKISGSWRVSKECLREMLGE